MDGLDESRGAQNRNATKNGSANAEQGDCSGTGSDSDSLDPTPPLSPHSPPNIGKLAFKRCCKAVSIKYPGWWIEWWLNLYPPSSSIY
jgi:hypothetical protein